MKSSYEELRDSPGTDPIDDAIARFRTSPPGRVYGGYTIVRILEHIKAEHLGLPPPESDWPGRKPPLV